MGRLKSLLQAALADEAHLAVEANAIREVDARRRANLAQLASGRVQCVDLTLSPPERTSRAMVRHTVALAQLAAGKHTVVALGKETALDGDGRPIRY